MGTNPLSRLGRRGFFGGVAAVSAAAAAATSAQPATAAPAATPVLPLALPDPSQQRKFFAFDSGLWNGHLMSNCKVVTGQFHKDTRNNPLFREGIFEDPYLPWEPRFDNGYPNVIWDPVAKLYRCYYTLFIKDPTSKDTRPADRARKPYVISGRQTGCAYAESKDGVRWTKPQLGIVDFEGSTANNLLFTDIQGTSVLYDAKDPNPARRFKLLTLKEKGGTSLCVAFSADGIHFSDLQPWPAASGSPVPGGDCHNQVFIDPRTNEYVLITRLWDNNIRVSAMSRSTDFINWSKPVEIHRGTGFESQIYSMPVFEKHGVYLGLASMFHDGDDTRDDYDSVDLELHWSSNTAEWQPVAVDPEDATFIPHGNKRGGYPNGEFDSNVVFSAVPIEEDDKLWFYYMGGKGGHTNWRESALGRGWIEKDRYAAYVPRRGNRTTVLTTQGLNFSEGILQILADIEPGGDLRCELRNVGGTVVQPGFELSKSRVSERGDGWLDISWRGSSLSSLNPNAFYALRVEMRRTKVWAIQGIYPRPLKYTKH
ncbi:hypothetical protein ACQB6R_10025 [Propionibacteriaceae bacterium G1746]|uniref:hypothetical protein n=1 Tax=Aestuariimicrobium sp. G57 TaxID=3418485 RepID=UPI003C1A464E